MYEVTKALGLVNKKILVVEDDESSYIIVNELLSESGVQMIHARSACQAIELCKKLNDIDLIVMDIRLPEMNGVDVARKIREMGGKTPIIAQTACKPEDIKSLSPGEVFHRVFIKPYDFDDFLKTVESFLN